MDNAAVSVDHYENFPVASLAVPAAAASGGRGDLPLRAHRRRPRRRRRRAASSAAWPSSPPIAPTCAMARGAPPSGAGRTCSRRWRRRSMRSACRCRCSTTCSTPSSRTWRSTRYADRAELLDYCRRSANPIGRLLLHLYGIDDAAIAGAQRRHLHRAAARPTSGRTSASTCRAVACTCRGTTAARFGVARGRCCAGATAATRARADRRRRARGRAS